MPTYEIQAPNGKTYRIDGPEGATDEQVQAEVLRQFPDAMGGGGSGSQRSTPAAPQAPGLPPVADARSITQSLFPDARITDWKRPADSPLGQKNPNSWHVRSGGAIDMAPIPGMTYDQAKQRFIDAGYQIIEDRDEVNNPVDYATGPHWHFVLAGGPEGQEAPAPAEGQDPAAPPQAGNQKPPAAPDTDSGFWRMPKDMNEFLEGQKKGLGNIVEGVASLPGMVVDPFNTVVSDIFGWQRPKPFAQDIRERLGLPEDDSLSGDIAKGIAGGIGGSGVSKLLAKATTGAVSKGLAEFGSTPIRDAVAGGGAAAGQSLAEDSGAGVLGQTGAAVIGGLAGYGASGLPKALSADARATRFATKEAAKNPYAAYDAEIASDISKAVESRAVSPSDPKGRAEITAKTLNNIEQSYYAQFDSLLNRTDLDDVSKLKLKEAMNRKYSIPKEEVDALRGTTEGDAVADAITKVQRLRQLTPELKRNPGWIAQTAKGVALAADVAPVFGLPGTYGAGSVGVRALLNKVGKITGDGEAARVHAAERLLKRNNAYSKLAAMTGPSGQRQSQQALWDKVETISSEAELDDLFKSMDAESAAAAKEAANLARQKEAAWNAKQKMEMGDKRPRPRSAEEEAAWRERQKADKPLSDVEKRKQEEAMWASVEPVPVTKSQVAAEEAGWNNILKIAQQRQAAKQAALKASAPKVDFTPPKPAPAPKAPKLSPEDAAIEDAIRRGIRGDSGVQNAFANRLGISPDDLPKVLDKIEQDLPDLAGEINRIRFNYPTKNRKIGSILGGRMAAAADELGIPKATGEAPAPRTVPVDEAAQANLASKMDNLPPPTKPVEGGTPQVLPDGLDFADTRTVEQRGLNFGDDGMLRDASGNPAKVEFWRDPETGGIYQNTREDGLVTKDTLEQQFVPYDDGGLGAAASDEIVGTTGETPQRNIRQIDRPQQWQQGKQNYQAAANAAMSDLYGDIRIGPDAMAAVKRVPEKIRDQFKTTDEATAYIENEVVPDLQAAKATNAEIDAIRSYLYEIAGSKPYATREAYEAGTKANQRGRPRKQAAE